MTDPRVQAIVADSAPDTTLGEDLVAAWLFSELERETA